MRTRLLVRLVSTCAIATVSLGCDSDASPEALDPGALTGTARYFVVNETDFTFQALEVSFAGGGGTVMGEVYPGDTLEVTRFEDEDVEAVLVAPPSAALVAIELVDPVGASSYRQAPIDDQRWEAEASEDAERDWALTLAIGAADVTYDNEGQCCCEVGDAIELDDEAACAASGGTCVFLIPDGCI